MAQIFELGRITEGTTHHLLYNIYLLSTYITSTPDVVRHKLQK